MSPQDPVEPDAILLFINASYFELVFFFFFLTISSCRKSLVRSQQHEAFEIPRLLSPPGLQIACVQNQLKIILNINEIIR